ncbi:ribosomal protein S18-alanine N-acetyltransferase [Janibacter sp. G56]|uniref:ribosomal protein S18-alanine N-acetyltransferase n=1 Tax=Janibacter sp. G56 TaxID=3418717 RepID=UPI003D009DA5
MSGEPVSRSVRGALRLREVRWHDIEHLAVLERELFPDDAWSEDVWWAELAARPRRDYLVAEDERGIVAYGGIDNGGDVADLMTIAVHPRARGGGRGRLLLEALIDVARQRGAEHLMLEVRADNEPALALYASRGFVTLQTRRRYYQPGDVDAIVMRLDLSSSTEASADEESESIASHTTTETSQEAAGA